MPFLLVHRDKVLYGVANDTSSEWMKEKSCREKKKRRQSYENGEKIRSPLRSLLPSQMKELLPRESQKEALTRVWRADLSSKSISKKRIISTFSKIDSKVEDIFLPGTVSEVCQQAVIRAIDIVKDSLLILAERALRIDEPGFGH
ncbi:hypothetical protein NPIL_219451 [Nephila pilipes]|uniref:Uncharacterized protein n=1 Tax=Nephila pilipes TaxID=299642 RepID=A0A8X6N596_NEPPI|nr:hypothetical protein NPIL_219451 [Nephila pilipes]